MKYQSSKWVLDRAESILELKTYHEMANELESISAQNPTAFRDVLQELKTLLILQPERIYTHHNNLTIDTLRLVKDIFKQEENIDARFFEPPSGYLLIAVVQGFLSQNLPPEKISKVKQLFAKRLQKNSGGLWGFEELENLQAYLIDKSTGYIPNPSPIHHDRQMDRFSYFYAFHQDYGYAFPQLTDVFSIIFKMMLCLREQQEKDKQLLSKLKQKYFSNRYHIQTTTKNMKFVLQFFKHSFSQKQCRFYPQKIFQSILSSYSTEEIQLMLTTTSTGVIWSQEQVYEYFLNCIKLGFTQISRKMMISMIKFCQKSGKYSELSYSYENNIKRIFIFMKYPKFFPVCLEILKYFIYSPPPTLSLYQKFLPEAIIFVGKVSKDHKFAFLNVLQIVAFAYKQTAPVEELNKLITQNIESEINKLLEEEIKKVINEYSWKEKMSFKSAVLNPTMPNKQKSAYKGLTNIGNSCYMNSFLQSLFMNRQFLRYIIRSSTLQIRQEKLKDNKFQGKDREFIEKQIQNCVKPFAELQKTFALLLKSIRNEISPANIRQVAPEMFRNSSQHDTIEFGRQFLDLIFRNNIPAMFEGEVTIQILCKQCGQARQRRQAFLDYHISAQCADIQDLIKSSFNEQIVKDLTCDHCQKKGEESIKHHFISKFPNYLIVSINRFQYDVIEKRNKKNKSKISINPTLMIDQHAYQVYSIIIHTGPSSNAGHYFTFSKTAYDQNCKWICHNDSLVSQFQNFTDVTNFLDNSLEDTPYIIFYEDVAYIQKMKQQLSQPIILRQPQDKFVKKDNQTYLSSQKKTTFQLKPINYNFFMPREDDEDNRGPGNGGGGFYNSYVA